MFHSRFCRERDHLIILFCSPGHGSERCHDGSIRVLEDYLEEGVMTCYVSKPGKLSMFNN